jgi:HTH-type transcriptional regulator / antitoxin MqsA
VSKTTACPECGGTMVAAAVTYITREGGGVLVENVPALVCRQCGYEAFASAVAEELERLLDERPAPTRWATIPVYELHDGHFEAPAGDVSRRSA